MISQKEVSQAGMEIFYLLNGTKVDRLPYSNGSDSSLTPALVSTRDTVSVSIKYSVVLCLEVRVRPGLLTTRTVTMGLIDVDCHNQLLGHLLRAQGLVGRSTHTSDLAADCLQPSSLPNTMVADRQYGGARVPPGFSAAIKSIRRWKELSHNALAPLPGLHTGSFC